MLNQGDCLHCGGANIWCFSTIKLIYLSAVFYKSSCPLESCEHPNKCPLIRLTGACQFTIRGNLVGTNGKFVSLASRARVTKLGTLLFMYVVPELQSLCSICKTLFFLFLFPFLFKRDMQEMKQAGSRIHYATMCY